MNTVPTAPPKTATGLSVQGLSVRHGHHTILHDITLGPFPPGVLCAVLGPNGSGKSTLLRAMGGLVPARGRVLLHGQALDGLPLKARARLCCTLPQSLPEPLRLSVLETLLAARRVAHPAQADDIPAALGWLERMGIASLALRPLNELSGGQRQLVGLAQALSRHPRALLLDEPLSALDPHYQYRVLALLREEAARSGLVCIMVLHDLNQALNWCQTACILHEGQVRAFGAPRTILTPALLHAIYRIHACVDTGTQGQAFMSVQGVETADQVPQKV
ncbi:ABC transporter ATP-binding protein [Acetobacter suratthaniensis]|uniref:ABC transporter ATP-binding protein n=1 Tax=Acetobacter suratthaniensis TaxID=1502841 RepID=A0ABS3LJQ2_9PROT|nr:ABC transporter ATP-binding protein [Acetobacter suratthaniensis]MBO1327814.1 ABC transporter ATP-binding protein [Acetobacter suratthaniensis]MCX2566006.1 ABC transporter ATP-binding protein [Acetobacter suratthaniensis]